MKVYTKSLLKTLFIVVGLFIASVFVVNTSPFDEKLNPEITKILQVNPPAPIEGNAYFAIMGINAPADKSIIETGEQLINRYKKNRANGEDDLSSEDYVAILGEQQEGDDEWREMYDKCDSFRDTNCLSKMSQFLLSSPLISDRLTLMMNRNDKIMRLKTYMNINDISLGTPFPSFAPLMQLGNIKKARLYNQDDKTEFLNQIAMEIEFWRLILSEGEMILDKMIAVAGIRNNLFFLSSSMRMTDFTSEQLLRISSILSPLTQQQMDIGSSFVSESRTFFKEINKEKGFELDMLLFQKNATNNLYHKYFTQTNVKLNKLSSSELLKVINNGYQEKLEKQRQSLISYNPTSLYNFSGKAAVKSNICVGCWNYTARTHDLNNIFNLVKLQLELKTVEISNIKQAIARSSNNNNYTQKAFTYNPKDNSIGFECLDKNFIACEVRL